MTHKVKKGSPAARGGPVQRQDLQDPRDIQGCAACSGCGLSSPYTHMVPSPRYNSNFMRKFTVSLVFSRAGRRMHLLWRQALLNTSDTVNLRIKLELYRGDGTMCV